MAAPFGGWGALEFLILRTCNNLVLELRGHVVEVVRVASHTYKKVLILVWVSLCLKEGSSIDYVELDMMTAEVEVCADEAHNLLEVFATLEELRHEPYVEERTARLCLVKLAETLDYGCRSLSVCSVGR